jgi:hypothetical protein
VIAGWASTAMNDPLSCSPLWQHNLRWRRPQEFAKLLPGRKSLAFGKYTSGPGRHQHLFPNSSRHLPPTPLPPRTLSTWRGWAAVRCAMFTSISPKSLTMTWPAPWHSQNLSPLSAWYRLLRWSASLPSRMAKHFFYYSTKTVRHIEQLNCDHWYVLQIQFKQASFAPWNLEYLRFYFYFLQCWFIWVPGKVNGIFLLCSCIVLCSNPCELNNLDITSHLTCIKEWLSGDEWISHDTVSLWPCGL